MSDTEAQPRRRLLLADDEPSMRKVLELRLNFWGYAVRCANDGAEAVQLAAAEIPDLILLDVMMPGMDGLQACRHLKADPKTCEIPVVLVTAKDTRGLAEQVQASGADAFLQKPYDYTVLQRLIQRLLR